MKKSRKWYFQFILMIFAISCLSNKEKEKPIGLPVFFSSCSESPLLKVNIEGTDYVLKIDLGATCNLMLKQRVLDQIRNKKQEGSSMGIDIQGNEYHKTAYKMPIFKIGHLQFQDAIATEEDEFFISTGSKPFGSNKRQIDRQLRYIDGRIGCSLLHSSVCFFDLSHSLFYFELSLEAIKKNVSLTDCFEVPFDFENGLVCIDFMTEKGIKKFVLDTGATQSLANKASFQNQGQKLKINELRLGSQDVGCWDFYLVDLPERLAWIDGFLGMDFFNKFAICLDFQNKMAYLKETHSKASNSSPFRRLWKSGA